MENDRPLRLSEAAALAGVNERTIRRWVDAGELQPIQVGGESRYRRTDVLATLEHRGPARVQRNRTRNSVAPSPGRADRPVADAPACDQVTHHTQEPRRLQPPARRESVRTQMYYDVEREAARAKVDVLRSRVEELQAQVKLEELEEQRRERVERRRREEQDHEERDLRRSEAEWSRQEDERRRDSAEAERRRERKELVDDIDDALKESIPLSWSQDERATVCARIRRTIRQELDRGDLIDLEDATSRIDELVAQHEREDANRRFERKRVLIDGAHIPLRLDLDRDEDEDRERYIRCGLRERVGADWTPSRVRELVRELEDEWWDADGALGEEEDEDNNDDEEEQGDEQGDEDEDREEDEEEDDDVDDAEDGTADEEQEEDLNNPSGAGWD